MRNLFICLFLVFSSLSFSADKTIVSVGSAKLEQNIIAFHLDLSRVGANARVFDTIFRKFKSNFQFYSKTISSEFSQTRGKAKASSMKKRGVDYLVTLSSPGKNKIDIEVKDFKKSKSLLSQSTYLNKRNIIDQAHELSNLVYEKIVGRPSVFGSKIVFVSDKGGRLGKQVKELFIMNFDGGEKKQLTSHRGVVISPSVSSDGRHILYSLIKNYASKKRRNVDLYIYDRKLKKSRVLSARKGINSGAIFLPGDKKIAFTLSHRGNADLYLMDLKTKRLTQLTKHYAPDVDPSFSADGRMMSFLSGRAGAAMIYTADANGLEKNVKRISYVGKFNATPRFSPDGRQIAFASWVDERFDLFRIGADGNGLVRLTKNFGSNEDPTYSRDGEFIAFSNQKVISRKKAIQSIQVMDKDGKLLDNLTKGFGNCITPRWSK